MTPIVLAPPPPRVQLPPPPAVVAACDRDPGGAACLAGALRAIDAARAREGLGPLILPRTWASLSVADQLLVLTDLERTARGLPPVLGVTPVLDASIAQALARRGDPAAVPPAPWDADPESGGSNWAGTGSVLLGWYVWMYDDGYGSQNLDCRAPTDLGCWGHRDNILAHYRQEYLAGVRQAEAATPLPPGSAWGPPATATWLAMDGGANAGNLAMAIVATGRPLPLAYTWSQALAAGAGNPAAGWNPAATPPAISRPAGPPPPRQAPSPRRPIHGSQSEPTGGGGAGGSPAGSHAIPGSPPAPPPGHEAGAARRSAAPWWPPIGRWLGSAAAAPWELAAMLVAAKRGLGGRW
ncbi:MAG: hypothetical protein K6U87_15575 [Firmicutes bacterium]|nr:hypothetical protein [Bacillota bacterium]